MEHVIVTGANGFVGSAVVRELAANGKTVLALDRPGCMGNIPQGETVRFLGCDLDQIKGLPAQIGRGYDTWYHFAWAGLSGKAREDNKIQIQNIQWTVDCLQTAKELGCLRFIGAGSIMEAEAYTSIFREDKNLGPSCIYGSAKFASHAMAKTLAVQLGVDFLWAKITNAYGCGELSPRFLNSTIRKFLSRKPLEFTSGNQVYDFVYITDVARAFYLVGEKGKAFGEYLIGSSHAKPLKEFIIELRDILEPDRELNFGALPAGVALPLKEYDSSRTEQEIGFRALVPFREGITLTRDWLISQRSVWERTINR